MESKFNFINLNDINLNNTTDLCSIMNKYGSDKGNGFHHNYTLLYKAIFENRRNEALNLFEVGLGTNNTDVPSNMGLNGKPGASLYGWREYFPNANIVGADVDKRILFQSDRISTFYVDQLNSEVIKNMWDNIPYMFDIIIDDGLHTYNANINFLNNSLNKLKKNGIYIIEDIHINEVAMFHKTLSENPRIQYSIYNIPNTRNSSDNILAVIKHK
jgi:hypothetical protein